MAFSVQGYRRFLQMTSIKLHGRLIAIVGPNEAGKSSLLKALEHLGLTDFQPDEFPRRSTYQPVLTWILQLDETDKAAIAVVHDAGHIEAVRITKRVGTSDQWSFEPRNPVRDTRERQTVFELLKNSRPSIVAEAKAAGDVPFSLDEYDNVIRHLASTGDLRSDQTNLIQKVAGLLEMMPSTGADDAQIGEVHDQVGAALRDLAKTELLDSPWTQCVQVLKPRIPRIVTFREEDRDLHSSYDLVALAEEPPPALAHLAHLAQLNLRELRDSAVAGRQADVATARLSANARLKEIYEVSWKQHEIAVQVEIDGTQLFVHATTPSDHGLSSISEHSDGLRWFAALLAFAHDLPDQPIILVDEIETHLHYDAQADLIEVLGSQQFASKVIYTTHSFGSLPPDLGTGVRVVRPIDASTSKLDNGFWSSGSGFSPLLASMGAATFSFTPARSAIIAEGPADAILLPTLLRQASSENQLGFQIAPGLSIVAPNAIRHLLTEAGRVGFLVDGDRGGLDIAKKLRMAGIPESLIVILRDGSNRGLETEDLIDRDMYVQAVNEELAIWNRVDTPLTARDLPRYLRSKSVESWCRAQGYAVPDKRAVAQRVVDRSGELLIYMASRKALMISLVTMLRSVHE